MFETGDLVIYGSSGVCEICRIAPLSFGQEGLYYILRILNDKRDNFIYSPVTAAESGKVVLRKLISREDALRLLSQSPEQRLEWIPDLRRRNEEFTRILSSGLPENWLLLLRCLHEKQQEKKAEQRSLPHRDRELLNLTEKLFFGELSAVLGESTEEIKKHFPFLLP